MAATADGFRGGRRACRVMCGVMLVAVFWMPAVWVPAWAADEAVAAEAAPREQAAEGEADGEGWESLGEKRGRGAWQGRKSRRAAAPLTEEELAQALAMLREINPEVAARVAEWQERSPERMSAVLASHLPMIRRFLDMRQRDRVMFELMVADLQLERRTVRLSRQMKQSEDGAQRQELASELRAAVERHFAVRQKMRERDLEKLEKRLADLQRQLQARQAQRESLIEERIEALSGPHPQARW